MELNESFEKTITTEKIERWRYPRFFTDNIGEIAVVTGSDAVHIYQVLRMKAGELVVICDGKGTDYLCRIIQCDKNAVELEILDKQLNEAEPTVNIRLFQCVPKSDKLDFIVQKAVELGANAVIPVLSKRCVSRPDQKSAVKKRERYQKIADEAAKQCGRGIIPEIGEMISFSEVINNFDKDKNLGILFYECGGESINSIIADNHKKNIDIIIGCEGGFEEKEVENAVSRGFLTATLGKRILRCETAPVSALSVLMNLTGNM